jgi:hypothetical protein
MALNLSVFAGVNLFWQYLHTGQWADFSTATLRQAMILPLGEILLEPLSIFSCPWMIVVIGVLLAVVIAVPLCMAVMYQLLLAMVFVVMVAVLGGAPMLALSLAAGCLISARTQWRRSFPFLAILLGLIPVAIYLYLVTYAGLDTSLLPPLQRWILAVPFLLAMVLAIVAGGATVVMARLMKFQPGVIWPVLLLLPAVVGLFYAKIGPDELHYALIRRDIAPAEAVFAAMPKEQWVHSHGAGLNEQTLQTRILEDMAGRKKSLRQRCEQFLARYPKSRRAPAVAWLGAQCQSVQLDFQGLESKLVSYTASYPQPASEATWRELLDEYPQADQAALALWRLGVLSLRKAADEENDDNALKQVALAETMLREAQRQLETVAERQRQETGTGGGVIFLQSSSLPAEQDYAEALLAVEVLRWKMQQNDVLTDPKCARAMAGLMGTNPYDQNYAQLLKDLATDPTYQNTKMADNLRMAVARSKINLYRRAAEIKQIADDERTDSAIEANYELGRISMQSVSAPLIRLELRAPEEYFTIVVAAPPNPWQARAAGELARRKTTTIPATPRERQK